MEIQEKGEDTFSHNAGELCQFRPASPPGGGFLRSWRYGRPTAVSLFFAFGAAIHNRPMSYCAPEWGNWMQDKEQGTGIRGSEESRSACFDLLELVEVAVFTSMGIVAKVDLLLFQQ